MKRKREAPKTAREGDFLADRFSIAPVHKRGKPIRDMVINLMSDKKHYRKNPSTTPFFLSFLHSVLIRPLQTYSFS